MNANGSNQTRLTVSSSGFLDDQPAWSPDGTKLAFTSTRDSTVRVWEEWILREGMVNKEIYVMNADGSSQARLTNKMGNDDSPAWSPDGTRIVFRSDRDRHCCDPYEQVWVMNADGSNQVNLSNNQFGDHCPMVGGFDFLGLSWIRHGLPPGRDSGATSAAGRREKVG